MQQKNVFFILGGILTVIIAAIFFLGVFDSSTPTENREERATLSETEQAQVTAYIQENIAKLSPQKAVLGGTFYVTDITFHDATNATVQYEDGHIALEADVQFSLSDDGAINITSFNIKETDKENILEESNFHETGVITKGGTTGWTFVYEAPGKPALTVSLAITESSQCTENDAWIPCNPPKWHVGSRAEISGTRNDDIVSVRTLKLSATDNSTSAPEQLCEDLCGDGTCQEIVCLGTGCPCAETPSSCPNDCSGIE